MRAVAVLVGAGLAGGITSGLLGVGGGIVMVPLLVFLARSSQKEAGATSLTAIVPLAVVGSLVYGSGNAVSLDMAIWLGLGSLLGVGSGIVLMRRTQDLTLRRAFGVLQFAVAAVLLLR